jgi:hypothetical protein
LTTLASGVAVGRVVPGLTHQIRWPYAILGAGFALVGIVAIAYGFVRTIVAAIRTATARPMPISRIGRGEDRDRVRHCVLS